MSVYVAIAATSLLIAMTPSVRAGSPDAEPDTTEDIQEQEIEPRPSSPRISWSMTARTTAYSYTGSRTRTGTWPAFGCVAVDPRVVPLGSRLLIEGFDGVVFRAEDTGGAVHGNSIDIYMESRASALRYGVQTRRVHILASGWSTPLEHFAQRVRGLLS